MMLSLAGAIAIACSSTDQIPVERGTVVEIVARTADISVTGHARDEVEVTRTGVDCRRLGNVIRLEVTGELTRLVIKVPLWMPTKVVATDGTVRADGLEGPIDINSTRGDISIRGGRERIIAKTGNGSVSVSEAHGQIDIQAHHRPVTLTNSSGDVQIVNVTGMTELTNVRAGRLTASTVTGEVRCDCTPISEGTTTAEWQLRANNGAIRLFLPPGTGAVVTLDAPRHAASSTYPGAKLEQLDDRQTVAVLGKGGARIRLTSFSGAVFLEQKTSPR